MSKVVLDWTWEEFFFYATVDYNIHHHVVLQYPRGIVLLRRTILFTPKHSTCSPPPPFSPFPPFASPFSPSFPPSSIIM